jgi:hypothetical protein
MDEEDHSKPHPESGCQEIGESDPGYQNDMIKFCHHLHSKKENIEQPYA